MKTILGMCMALLACAAQATDRTWTGGVTGDNNWSTAANWGGAAPEAGDALLFSGTSKLTNTNDLAADGLISGLTFTSGAGAFTLRGNALTLGGNLVNLSASAPTIDLPLALSGTRTFYGSNVALTVNGTLSGIGGLVASVTNNTLKLTGDNTYEGVTIVTNGGLWVTHANALGSTNAHTMVYCRANGSLQLSGGIVLDEPLTLSGQRPNYGYTLYCSAGSNTIRGAITKMNEIRVNAAGGSTLVISGGIQPAGGAGDMVVNANGTMIFDTKPINLGGSTLWSDNGGIAALAVSNNVFSTIRTASGTVRTDVPNAVPAGTVIYVGVGYSPNGTFNLNGCDQTVSQLLTDTTNAGTRTVTSPTRAVLTLNQNASTTYNGSFGGAVCLLKSGTGTFLLTNATSTTTGDILVSNGTFIVTQSAGFSAISNLVVGGGTLDLRTQTAIPDTAALAVAGSGTVAIGATLNETVGKLFINGVQQVSGTWGGASSGAAHTDTHFSGTGKLTVLSSPPITAVNALWDGGAADTLFSTAANWSDDALPAFDGATHAIFATGGLTATVDTAVSLYGMTFNSDTNFTVLNGSGSVSLGAGGMTAALPTPVSRSYVMAEDLTLTEFQTWCVTNNGAGSATLTVSGAIGDGVDVYGLIKYGNGVLALSGNNTYDGATTIKTGGVVRVTSGTAFGSTNGATTVENGGWVEMSGGINLTESIALYGDYSTSHQGVLRSTGGSNTLSGLVLNGSRIRCTSGSLDIIGGVTGSQCVLGCDNGSYIRVAEKPININSTFFAHTGSLIILDVGNNVWPQLEVSGNFVRTDKPNALPPTSILTVGSGTTSGVDLNGNSQTIGRLDCAATTPGMRLIYSAAPATLTVNQNANSVFNGAITGQVSLVKGGTYNLLLSNTNTTYGSFIVSNGTLTVSGTGTLGANSLNMVVGGTGTLVLSNSVALADSAALSIAGGAAKIHLAEGVNESVGYLYLNGTQQRVGTYGSLESGADSKSDVYFAGKGKVTVLSDDFGTILTVR